jgi:hypothetical protein
MSVLAIQSECLSAESLGRTRFRLGRFFFPILGWSSGVERVQKARRDARNFVDGSLKCGFICFGGFVEAGYFPYELQRRGSNFFIGDGRIEVEKGLDIPAHNELRPPESKFQSLDIFSQPAQCNTCTEQRPRDTHYLCSYSTLMRDHFSVSIRIRR